MTRLQAKAQARTKQVVIGDDKLVVEGKEEEEKETPGDRGDQCQAK